MVKSLERFWVLDRDRCRDADAGMRIDDVAVGGWLYRRGRYYFLRVPYT